MDWRTKLNAYRELYSEIGDEIMRSEPNRYSNSYRVFKTVRDIGLSPIEEIVWDFCRCEGVVFYPQYPIGNYMVDFCNPLRKIVVECDGKNYHDAEKDYKRDMCLIDLGFKVFRLKGSDIVKDHQPLLDQINFNLESCFDEDDFEMTDLYMKYYVNTAHGFMVSIKDILLVDNLFDRNVYHFEYKLQSLLRNRIVNSFQVLPPYNQKK